MTDLWRLDATDIARRVHAREVSAREVTLASLARLDAVNPRLNAVIQFMPEQALAAADAVDAQIARGETPGLLAGVPVTVKVNVDQLGFATTNGLKIQADAVAKEDSPVVSNLRRAGAVIIGRTNTPAFSLRWFTSNDIHGATFNPRDKGLTPGGSSGGAASATTAGIGAIGHGTDIGGSVRFPAYACGIHGLRPTLGRIPAWNPGFPDREMGAQLMAVSGPLARTIPDLRLALAAMSAPDARDPWWVPAPLEGPPVAKRAALCVAPDGMKVAPVIAEAVRDAGARLRAAGWEVEEMANLPPLREPARLQARLWLSMLPRGGLAAAERENEACSLKVYGYMQALTAPPTYAEYQDALTARLGFLRAWNLFFERYPVVLMPVSGELPFTDQADQGGAEAFSAILEAQLTQVGLPLLSLPGLAVATGLSGTAPLGVQLVAGRYREDLLLAAGETIAAAGAPPSPIDPAWS